MRKDALFKKTLNEGYCCLHGYFRLCAARGETPKSMGKFLSVPADTIRYNKRKNPQCQNIGECMLTLIESVEKATSEPRS